MTIARGSLPLLMFGPAGYGRVIGRIARPALFVQASAPFVVAAAVERFSDAGGDRDRDGAALAGLGCFLRSGRRGGAAALRSLGSKAPVLIRTGAFRMVAQACDQSNSASMSSCEAWPVVVELRAVQQLGVAFAGVDDRRRVRLDGVDAAPDVHHRR